VNLSHRSNDDKHESRLYEGEAGKKKTSLFVCQRCGLLPMAAVSIAVHWHRSCCPLFIASPVQSRRSEIVDDAGAGTVFSFFSYSMALGKSRTQVFILPHDPERENGGGNGRGLVYPPRPRWV